MATQPRLKRRRRRKGEDRKGRKRRGEGKVNEGRREQVVLLEENFAGHSFLSLESKGNADPNLVTELNHISATKRGGAG